MKRSGTTNLSLDGQRFGRLTVIEALKERVHGNVMWRCVCDCGVETTVRGGSLTSGNTNSCGCLKSRIRKNNKYGKLTTIERMKDSDQWKWRCLCDCGNETLVIAGNLLQNNTKSCGCLNSVPDMSDETRHKHRHILATDESPHYSTWRRKVLENDGYTCVVCGHTHADKYDNVAHHLDGYDWCEQGRVDIENGVTVCSECHKAFHKEYGNKNNTKSQFEEFCKKNKQA